MPVTPATIVPAGGSRLTPTAGSGSLPGVRRAVLMMMLPLVLGVALVGCGGGSAATIGPFSGSGITVQAVGIQFEPREIQLPAGQPLRIVLDNRDAGVPHDIGIRQDGRDLGTSAIVTGPAMTEVRFGPLEPGTYQYVCTVHPSMMGTLTIVP
jgi:plastocyanin